MKRIYAQNEPWGEGCGWDDCSPDLASIWTIEDRDNDLTFAEAVFETYFDAQAYLEANP